MASDGDNRSASSEIRRDGEVWEQQVNADGAGQEGDYQLDSPLYSTDEFRMYCFKIARCSKKYSHDWTQCPFAHPGEKARRRDPQQYKYAAIACIDMKKNGTCPRGDSCPYAHNVFEYWMHPTRYRTQICNDGAQCNRSVCFFAHSLEELRVPPHKPGFPPEWRNRKHSRSNSTGNSNSSPTKKCSTHDHSSTGLARALSVPVPVSCDTEGGYKMQMSDGTWGSPGRRVSRVQSGPCPSITDLFGSSPGAGLSPHLWSQGLRSSFSSGGYPSSARSARSFDGSSIPEHGSNEDMAGMILQLIDKLSLSGQQTAAPNNISPNSLEANQIRALQLAAVRKALNSRSSPENASPESRWGQGNKCDVEQQFMAGTGSIGEANMVGPRCSGQAPFPMMARDIDVPGGVGLDGFLEASPPQRNCLTVPYTYECTAAVSGISM